MLLLNNIQNESEETLELEIGQIVYWESETSDEQNIDLIKSEVIAVNEILNQLQILPLKDECLIRVPIWVAADDISLVEDTIFM